MTAVLERLRQQYPDEEILIVCHDMVMLSIWAHFTGFWKGVDEPPNCALAVVEHDSVQYLPPVLVTTSSS